RLLAMAKTMLVVSEPARLGRIPELLRQAGVFFDKKEAPDHTFYYCRDDKAEVWVSVAPKQTFEAKSGGPQTTHFYPVFVFPKPALFRAVFKGPGDRRLQDRVLGALEPIKDLEFTLKM